MADPSELRATRSGAGLGTTAGGIRLTLRWRWATAADAALIVACQGSPPEGPTDPAAIKATVTRADYHRRDCWTLALPPALIAATHSNIHASQLAGPLASARSDRVVTGPWHIKVYSLIDLDGVRSISPGLDRPTATMVLAGPNPEVTVSYGLKKPWIPGFPWSVTFRTEPRGSAIPPMVLVTHPRAVPLSVDDGQIVAHFPSGRDGSQFPFRTPFKLSSTNARLFPDPNVEPDTLIPIRLRHPETAPSSLRHRVARMSGCIVYFVHSF